MRKDSGSNPWFYPLPVLIVGTCDESGRPDAMNAARSACKEVKVLFAYKETKER